MTIVSALLVAKGPIDRIARDAQPARRLADVVARFRIRGQHMRALNLMQIAFEPVPLAAFAGQALAA